MAAADELRDPWGWLVAAVSGGVGWAVLAAPLGPLAIPVGIGIGAAVMGTKVALGSRGQRHDADSTKRPSQLPRPPRGSPQAALLAQAELAQRRIGSLADAPGDQWLSDRIGKVDDDVAVVRDRLTELAGRVTVADGSIESARPDLLADDRARLAAAIAAETDPALKAERSHTLAALDSQIESVNRIAKLRVTLLSRMQTAVLGLEGLAARMGELVALGDDAVAHDRSAEVLSELTGDLDTVRAGLAEAEELSRRLP
jgi:hypothetical protein